MRQLDVDEDTMKIVDAPVADATSLPKESFVGE